MGPGGPTLCPGGPRLCPGGPVGVNGFTGGPIGLNAPPPPGGTKLGGACPFTGGLGGPSGPGPGN